MLCTSTPKGRHFKCQHYRRHTNPLGEIIRFCLHFHTDLEVKSLLGTIEFCNKGNLPRIYLFLHYLFKAIGVYGIFFFLDSIFDFNSCINYWNWDFSRSFLIFLIIRFLFTVYSSMRVMPSFQTFFFHFELNDLKLEVKDSKTYSR